ncbi:MAG: exopolysaccharide biosynthesis protein [Alphaproteobacteria bacterium]|nr:exopolysaccharide biosynthesis protein [Alphaproteobacteria bacterium]
MNHHTESNLRTTEVLENIARDLGDARITLGEFMSKLSDRAFGLAILIFALPNTIPLGIPGVSSICAVPIAIFALQMLVGRSKVWLPRFIRKQSFEGKSLKLVIQKCLPYLRKLDRIFKPRMLFATKGMTERLVGLIIMIHAAIIFLPIPGGNFIPAICMCMLALGLLERDGLVVLLGIGASVLTIGGMTAIILKIVSAAWVALLGVV